MKTKRVLPLVVAAAAAAFVMSAEAAMYKWTDKQGNVHYTQEPPLEGDAKEIAGPSRVAPPAANKGNPKRSGAADDAKTAENKPPLTPEQQEIYNRNCEAARGNLELYKAARRVQQPDGEIVDMNDETRQQKMQAAEEQVKRFCQ